jgi:hypothetical protein
MGWDGMGWDGMGWDGMGWDGILDPIQCVQDKASLSLLETSRLFVGLCCRAHHLSIPFVGEWVSG